ncbi:hypothetical protein KKH23_07750 [Patescibacteria group bacterium]|nr:hypothetical protein [Patescibacteria group bacterium]
MKSLRTTLEEVITPDRLGATTGPAEIVDNVLKALKEYVTAFEELECMLLELRPDGEFSFKSHPNPNCTLIYSVKKE